MIDLPTLLVAMVVTDLILAVSLWIGSGTRLRDGLGAWIASLLVRAAGVTIFALEGLARDPNSIVLAVGLVTFSMTLRSCRSFWSWKTRPRLRRRNGIAPRRSAPTF